MSLFSCVYWPFVCLKKDLFWVFCPLFDWAVCFSDIELYELLIYTWETNLLSIVLLSIVSFHSEGCLESDSVRS